MQYGGCRVGVWKRGLAWPALSPTHFLRFGFRVSHMDSSCIHRHGMDFAPGTTQRKRSSTTQFRDSMVDRLFGIFYRWRCRRILHAWEPAQRLPNSVSD